MPKASHARSKIWLCNCLGTHWPHWQCLQNTDNNEKILWLYNRVVVHLRRFGGARYDMVVWQNRIRTWRSLIIDHFDWNDLGHHFTTTPSSCPSSPCYGSAGLAFSLVKYRNSGLGSSLYSLIVQTDILDWRINLIFPDQLLTRVIFASFTFTCNGQFQHEDQIVRTCYLLECHRFESDNYKCWISSSNALRPLRLPELRITLAYRCIASVSNLSQASQAGHTDWPQPLKP